MNVLHNLTEGGQTWAHRVRMFRQVVKIIFTFSLLASALAFGILMAALPVLYYQGTWYHLKAQITDPLQDKVTVDPNFWSQVAGERYSSAPYLSTKKVLLHTSHYVAALQSATWRNLYKAGLIALVTSVGLLTYFLIRGKTSKNKKHISGQKSIHPLLLKARLILTRQASPIRIGSVPMVKGTETQHTLITGGTGSGKTNCLFHILNQVRRQRQKAIVIDTTGAFLERFYRSDIDILLNPFNPSGRPWHPWIECKDKFDYEALAESFIPQSYSEQDNYWRQAARSLFSSCLQKLEDSRNVSELMRWLLFEPLPNLCKFVQFTKAASHLDLNSEKTAGSIRSVTASFIECLENIKDTDQAFSIREWVENEDDNSWLFIHCTPAQRASINPLLSSWISVAVRALLNLQPNLHRRLWFILDELPSLQKIKDLESLLTEGRKYGGCSILALQSIAQLEKIYGRESSKTIIGNCSTKIVFSEHDPEVAGKISRVFGEREIREFQEGISYGAHEVRDGVSLSSQTKQQPIVSTTAIQSLEKNQAFIKLPGNLPITKARFSLVERTKKYPIKLKI